MDQATVYKHFWLTLYGSKVPYNIAYSSIKGKKSVVTSHDHDFAEIIWFTHGHGHHIINGEEFTVTKDHLIAILPGDIHEIYAHGQQVLSHYNLALQSYVVDFYKEHYGQKDGNIFSKCEAGERLTILNSDQKQVLEESMAILYASPVEKIYLDRFMLNLFCSLKSPMFSDTYHNLPGWLQVACKKIQGAGTFHEGRAGPFFAGAPIQGACGAGTQESDGQDPHRTDQRSPSALRDAPTSGNRPVDHRDFAGMRVQ